MKIIKICFFLLLLLVQGCFAKKSINHIDCTWQLEESFVDKKSEDGYFSYRNDEFKSLHAQIFIGSIQFRNSNFDWAKKGYHQRPDFFVLMMESKKKGYVLRTFKPQVDDRAMYYISEIMKDGESVVLTGKDADESLALHVVDECIKGKKVNIPPY